MAEIRTQTFTTGDVVTTYQTPELVRDWVRRHIDALKNKVPDGNTLTTTWPIDKDPGTASTTTTRIQGESNDSFIDRHATDTLFDMVQDPPDPS